MPETSSLRLTTLGARCCRRAKASSCPVREVFISVWKRVTAMVEPAARVGGGDAVEGRRESGFERFGCAGLGGPQGILRLGPAGLDRREIGRIARQIEELEPRLGQNSLDG